MHNERRILFNTAVLGTAEGLGQLANLVLIISFARTFGARVMGYYSVGMSVGAVAAIFVSLGIQQWLVREISRDPACASKRLGTLFPVQVLLVPVAWGIACVVSIFLIGDSAAIGVVMAAAGYQVLLPLSSLLAAPLQAREKMRVSASCSLLHRLLILAIGLAAIRLGMHAGTVALAFVAGGFSLIGLVWNQTSRHFGAPSLCWAPREALQLYHLAAPFFGLSALAVIYARGPMIVLSALTASQAVGLYAVADRLLVPLALGPSLFNSAVYPALARVAHISLAEARALSSRCLRLLLVVAIPCAALATILASDIVRLFFGNTYPGAVPALQVLVWTLPIRGAQSLLGSQLAAMNQQAALARARLAGLCLFALFSPLLILSRGYVGAAWAVLACDAAQLTLYWWLLSRVRAAPTLGASFLAPAAAAALTAAASTLMVDMSLTPRLVVAVMFMAAGMWIFGAVRMHDLKFLRTVMGGKEPAPPK